MAKILAFIGISLLVIVTAVLIYMKTSCSGLWEKQVSKIPNNILTKKEDEPYDYTQCRYVGFKKMISYWTDSKN